MRTHLGQLACDKLCRFRHRLRFVATRCRPALSDKPSCLYMTNAARRSGRPRPTPIHCRAPPPRCLNQGRCHLSCAVLVGGMHWAFRLAHATNIQIPSVFKHPLFRGAPDPPPHKQKRPKRYQQELQMISNTTLFGPLIFRKLSKYPHWPLDFAKYPEKAPPPPAPNKSQQAPRTHTQHMNMIAICGVLA